MERKLIIADDEKYICVMLEKLIRFEALDLKLLAVANDGETLLALIKEEQPDIVITDISMPKLDGLDVIRTIREEGIRCRFIIISGYRQFEYAYNALKYDVSDYILKPVDGEELNETLKRICYELRSVSPETEETAQRRQQILDPGVIREQLLTGGGLAAMNREYLLHFQEGFFRYACLKIQPKSPSQSEIEDVTSLVRKLDHLMGDSLIPLSHEVITRPTADGILCLLNYGDSRRMREALSSLLQEAQSITGMFEGYLAELCIGAEVSSIRELPESFSTMQFAEWAGRYYGCGKALFSEELPRRNIGEYEREILNITSELDRAFTALDSSAMQAAMVELFAFPKQVICTEPFLQAIQGQIRKFSADCEKLTRQSGQAELILKRLEMAVHNTTGFMEFRDALVAQMTEILKGLADEIRGKNALPVRKAKAYINEHYRDGITLEEVAAEVNLSPAYFSNLFRKDTGSTYIDYVMDVRLEKAKELLRMSDMNVNEIAEYLGFTKARYFSKLFKKKVGVKPTDYRKIHG